MASITPLTVFLAASIGVTIADLIPFHTVVAVDFIVLNTVLIVEDTVLNTVEIVLLIPFTLAVAVETEQLTIDYYTSLLQYGDESLNKALQRLIGEETAHRDRLKKMLNDVHE